MTKEEFNAKIYFSDLKKDDFRNEISAYFRVISKCSYDNYYCDEKIKNFLKDKLKYNLWRHIHGDNKEKIYKIIERLECLRRGDPFNNSITDIRNDLLDLSQNL